METSASLLGPRVRVSYDYIARSLILVFITVRKVGEPSVGGSVAAAGAVVEPSGQAGVTKYKCKLVDIYCYYEAQGP